MMEKTRFEMPQKQGEVGELDSCPMCEVRRGAIEKSCWYCIYADFHLTKPQALEKGVCHYPEIVMK